MCVSLRVSFSHSGTCRRINSIPSTFTMKANVNDLREVMELKVHGAYGSVVKGTVQN